MYRKQIDYIQDSLKNNLKLRGIEHRNRFINMFISRYREMLPHLIIYKGIDITSINPLKLENSLRSGYNVVVGQANNGKIMILGYINSPVSGYESANDMLGNDLYTKENINFVVSPDLIPKYMNEISNYNDCQTGNFIVLKNKALNYLNDNTILEHYTVELAEIVLSRFTISMQTKINTFFIGDPNDETINQLVSDLYNGSPFVTVTKLFDPKDNIYTLDNGNLSQVFSELKREYQNKISELNSMLGINSLSVEKNSGVSDVEAKSNRGFTSSNSNIYLNTRQNELDKLNKRFNLDISVMYDDDVASQLSFKGDDID